MFNRSLQLTVSSLLLAAAGAAHAQTPAVGLDVIQKYAPTIYLHPYDNHHPMAVEPFLGASSMLDQSGNVLKNGLTAADLATYSGSTNYLRFTNNVFPTAGNDFETGDPIVPGTVSGWGQSNAPVYVKTIDNGSYIDLKFYMFYAINGFQTFQAGIIVNFKTQPYLFDWANFALHQGDWEHVTVRISEDTTRLLGVFYSQHGKAVWVPNPSLDGTHPVVYSAWDSHANFPTADIYIDTVILNSPGIIPLSWLKVANITTNTAGGTTVAYHRPNPYYANGISWTPWQNTSQLVLLDGNPATAPWLAFNGNWGPSWTTAVDQTPSLPSGAGTELYDLATVGNALGLLNNYTSEGGPLGPQAAGWNVSNEGVAGTFSILSKQSGLALDAGGNQQAALVLTNSPNASANQSWVIAPSGNGSSITSAATGLALDGGANQSGTHPQMWPANGTPDQQWTIQPSGSGYSITSVQSSLVLDGGVNQAGTNPQMYGTNGTVDQQWLFQ
jgi:Vacuolar protein sorting-associated protein 62/Ricin-type beta-trefoil lectin domain